MATSAQRAGGCALANLERWDGWVSCILFLMDFPNRMSSHDLDVVLFYPRSGARLIRQARRESMTRRVSSYTRCRKTRRDISETAPDGV